MVQEPSIRDIATPHLEGIFPTATDFDCLGCHDEQRAQFVATKGSYHMVGGLTTTTASGKGAYINGWTYNSLVGCMGCHGDLKDGKAQKANILKRPYTYTSNSSQSDMLCFLCHDRATYGGGDEDRNNNTGFRDGDENLHNIGDHKVNKKVQCSWCHAAVPHATDKQNLIVVKGEPNSAGNIITSYTQPSRGSYDERNCGSRNNECDDHDDY